MRSYLFIDLHMHSTYSCETGCDASPSDILDNSITKAMQVKEAMKEKIDEVVKNEPEKFIDLIRDFCCYLDDKVEQQNEIYNKIISSKKPVELLKDYIDAKTKCCISITDHQNIQGSVEALKIIKNNPGKYEMIDFIPGIEVNAGLRCIGKNKEGFSDYKKCHALAYGYDINDSTFIAFSKLYHCTISKIEVGKMVLLARKRIQDIYGVNIPLKEIGFVVDNSRTVNDVKNKFFKYIQKNYPKVDLNNIKCENSNFPCFDFTQQGNERAISGSKWELDEYMLAIDKAGGKFSVAHPYSIKNKIIEQEQTYYNNEFIKELVRVTKIQDFKVLGNENLKVDNDSKSKYAKDSIEKSTKEKIREVVNKINKKYNKKFLSEEIYQAYIEFMYGRNIERFVRKVIEIRKRLNIGDNEFGFEIFNKINLSGAKSKILYDIATEYNLFATGGSDYHGNLFPRNSIGKCFDKDFIESTGEDLFKVDNKILQEKIDKTLSADFNNMLVKMPFIDFVRGEDISQNRQEIKFYNIPNGIIYFNNDLFDRHRTWIVKPEWTPESIKKCLDVSDVDHISRLQFGYVDKKNNIASYEMS